MRVQTSKILCLNSGGLDSLVVMALAKSLGYKLVTLFIDYGHSSNKREEEAAIAMSKYYGAEYYREEFHLNIWRDIPFFKDSLSPSFMVPQRNFVLFSIAAAYCDALLIPTIGLAWDGYEKDGLLYSVGYDKHKTFVNTLRKAFDEGSGLGWVKNYNLNTYAPLLNLSKREIGELGKAVNAPFHLSWSCYGSERNVCGLCIKCKERKDLELIQVSNTNADLITQQIQGVSNG